MDPNTQELVMGSAGASAGPPVYIEDVFSTWLYTGNGSTQTITNEIDLSGKGGLVWVKARTDTSGHRLVDTARGASGRLESNSTAAAATESTGLTSFDAQGFTLGSSINWNQNTTTYASWTFRKAPKFFDVVTYTGDGTAGKTISHTLDSVPGCIIIKSTSDVDAWRVYHRSAASNPETVGLVLNNAGSRLTASSFWNDTAPISTHFTVGTNGSVNASGQTYVAYLFANDAGGFGNSGNDSVVKCGSYAGTGGAGLFVDLGWEPQFVLIKAATTTGNWWMSDNMRGFTSNGAGVATTAYLTANTLDGESTFAIACNSTGFTIQTTGTSINAAGNTYIYIAIRRGPMKMPTDATKVFSANTFTDTGSATISPGFPLDAGIINLRSGSVNNSFVGDRLRGGPLYLRTSLTAAEASSGGSWLVFDQQNSYKIQLGSGATSVSYAFRRAPGFFDVVAYTGDGSSSRLISHNLGVPPELIITKRRDSTSTTGWFVSSKYYYVSTVWDRNGRLNDGTIGFSGGGVYEPASSHSSTVYPLSTNIADLNGSGGTYVAYLFASCPGVSKCGIYTGTGTTQQINCNFTSGARFVLIKRTDSSGDWYVWDSARGIIAGNDPYLLLNSTAVEVTGTDYIDTYAAGFEISSPAPAAINANGGSFIYLAIA